MGTFSPTHSFFFFLISLTKQHQRAPSVVRNGVSVLVELLRKRRLPVYDAETPASELPPLIRVVASHLGDCHAIISAPDPTDAPMDLTWGHLEQPLGLQRECVLELIEALTLTNNTVVFDALLASPVLQTAIDLFFQFVWNNFLHQTVYSIIATIIPSSHAALKNHLLTTCRLLDLTLDAEAANKIEFDEKNTSRGYIGHLTKISGMINTAADGSDEEHPGDPAIKALLDERASWKEYSETVLGERVKLESQLLGGVRPTAPPAMDDGEPGSDASGQLASMMYRIGGVGSIFEPQQQEDEGPDDGDIGENVFDPSEFDARGPFSTDERHFAFDPSANFDNDDDEDEDEDEDDDDESSSSGSEEDGMEDGIEDEGDVLIHTGAVEVDPIGGASSSDGSAGSPMSPLMHPSAADTRVDKTADAEAHTSLDGSGEGDDDDEPLPSPPSSEPKGDSEPLPDVPMPEEPQPAPPTEPEPAPPTEPVPPSEQQPAPPTVPEAPAETAAEKTTEKPEHEKAADPEPESAPTSDPTPPAAEPQPAAPAAEPEQPAEVSKPAVEEEEKHAEPSAQQQPDEASTEAAASTTSSDPAPEPQVQP